MKESVIAREPRLAAFVVELVKPMICYKKRACNVGMECYVMKRSESKQCYPSCSCSETGQQGLMNRVLGQDGKTGRGQEQDKVAKASQKRESEAWRRKVGGG